MEERLGVVAIIVEGGKDCALAVQNILSDYADLICGRMGVPDKERGVSVISVIVRGTIERISAMTGKLGKQDKVIVKSAITSY